MKFVTVILLLFFVSAKAQNTIDTLNYSGGFDSLGKHLLKYLAHHDWNIDTNTYYVAEVDFDENCKISDISLFVAGNTSYNSLVIRAIASTENNWSSTRSHPWRLTLSMYVFQEDESGWYPKAPRLTTEYVVFNSKEPAGRKIKLQPIEIRMSPPERRTFTPGNPVH